MADPVKYTFKINGSPWLVNSLAAVMKEHRPDFTVKSVGAGDSGARLRLGLSESASLVASVTGTADLLPLASVLHEHLSARPSEAVSVQTPFRTVTMTTFDTPSAATIQERIVSALRP